VKEEPAKKSQEDAVKKPSGAPPPPASVFPASESANNPGGETEFLTGDMINSFLKDPDGSSGK